MTQGAANCAYEHDGGHEAHTAAAVRTLALGPARGTEGRVGIKIEAAEARSASL